MWHNINGHQKAFKEISIENYTHVYVCTWTLLLAACLISNLAVLNRDD